MHSPLRVKIQNALNKAFQLEKTDVLFVGGRRQNRKRRKHGELRTNMTNVYNPYQNKLLNYKEKKMQQFSVRWHIMIFANIHSLFSCAHWKTKGQIDFFPNSTCFLNITFLHLLRSWPKVRKAKFMKWKCLMKISWIHTLAMFILFARVTPFFLIWSMQNSEMQSLKILIWWLLYTLISQLCSHIAGTNST